MTKITEENRLALKDAVLPYKERLEVLFAKEKTVLATLHADTAGQAKKKLSLADEMTNASSLYMAMDALSLKILDVKNNEALNAARKLLYKAVIYIEDVVTDAVDVSFAELTDALAPIADVPVTERYTIIQKLGCAIDILKARFGDNSKWKWSFVELEGRHAAVAKNLIDMKQAVKEYFDPNAPNYETTVTYVRLITKLLDRTANGYRDRYELSTRRIDDIKNAIKFLLASHKVFSALGDRDKVEEVKTKAVVWNNKMKNDQKLGLNS
ncbi:MAG: hypothetical protein IJ191_02790 [Treponema sp.]|nr:hypothetical protein [Treponema sp.]